MKNLLKLILPLCFTVALFQPPAWAVDTDIYRTQDLPQFIQKAKNDYGELKKGQEKRSQEILKLNGEIEKIRIRVGNNPKKNKEAAKALDDALLRQKVFKEKNAYYIPKINEKLLLYKSLSQTYKDRQAEINLIPKKSMSQWSVQEAQRAKAVYGKLLTRAQYRFKYYEKSYSGSATTIQESARRQNFLNELQSEIRPLQKQYNGIHNYIQQIEAQKSYDRQLEEQYVQEMEDRKQELAEKPAAVQKPRYFSTPQNLVASTPWATPVPTPEPVKEDFFEKFDQFLTKHKIWSLIAFFLATALSLFLSIQLSDADNEKHNFIAPLLMAAVITVFFALPFPSVIVGCLGFILTQPLYYQLSMDKVTTALPLSLALLLALSTVFLGIVWLLATLLN